MEKGKIRILVKKLDQMKKEVKDKYEEEAPEFPFTKSEMRKALVSGKTNKLEFAINDMRGYASNDALRLQLLDAVREYSAVKPQKIRLSAEEARIMFGRG